jgi:hypothetical protein
MENAVDASPEHPVLIDRYLTGKEVEVDAISDGETVVIPGIMEHIERAGVHSGDSIAVYPPQTLTETQIKTLEDYTIRLAKGLNVIGLMNIQYVISKGSLCHRSESTFVQNRSFLIENHRCSDGKSGNQSHSRNKTERFRIQIRIGS